MSAYTNLVSLRAKEFDQTKEAAGATVAPFDFEDTPLVGGKLASFVAATKEVEAALFTEQTRIKKMKDEVALMHSRYGKLLVEAEARADHLQKQNTAIEHKFALLQRDAQTRATQDQGTIQELKMRAERAEAQQSKLTEFAQQSRSYQDVVRERLKGAVSEIHHLQVRLKELESQLKESQTQSTEALKQEANLREQLAGLQKTLEHTRGSEAQKLAQVRRQAAQLSPENANKVAAVEDWQVYAVRLKKWADGIAQELAQYRRAWMGVLEREREAKHYIQNNERTQAYLAQVQKQLTQLTEQRDDERSRREQLERHSKSYQTELQSTLIRLHSAEARLSELSREYQVLQQIRRDQRESHFRVDRSDDLG